MTTKVCPYLWREKVPALHAYFVGKYGPLWCWSGATLEPDKQDRKAMRELIARAASRLPPEERKRK